MAALPDLERAEAARVALTKASYAAEVYAGAWTYCPPTQGERCIHVGVVRRDRSGPTRSGILLAGPKRASHGTSRFGVRAADLNRESMLDRLFFRPNRLIRASLSLEHDGE